MFDLKLADNTVHSKQTYVCEEKNGIFKDIETNYFALKTC